MAEESSWGGSREGAGRPSLSDEDTVRKTVTIPEPVAEWLEREGGGNASRGLRKVYRDAMEDNE